MSVKETDGDKEALVFIHYLEIENPIDWYSRVSPVITQKYEHNCYFVGISLTSPLIVNETDLPKNLCVVTSQAKSEFLAPNIKNYF
jgi:hypothetical protein